MVFDPRDPEQAAALRHQATRLDWNAAEMRDQAVRLWMVGWDQPETPARISALVDLARLLRADAAAMRTHLRAVAQPRQPRTSGGNPPASEA